MEDPKTMENGNGHGELERVKVLEQKVAALTSQAAVPTDEGVIYRPPLWSQNSAYSAADDRRLITAALWPGVVDFPDLQVKPREAGANMTVDVMPGQVVVKGTEHSDQGSYLCALAAKRNLTVNPAPAAGNFRWDRVLARVYEPADAPAYWQLEVNMGRPRADGGIDFDPRPPSSYTLAYIWVGDQTTAQIDAGRIVDLRRLSRPGPLGSFWLVQQRMGPMIAWNSNPIRWGIVERLQTPGPPVDIEARVDGIFRTERGEPAIGTVAINIAAGTPDAWSTRGEPQNIFSPELRFMMPFSRSLVQQNYQPGSLDWIRAEVTIAESPLAGGGARFHSGLLTVRVTPSGGALQVY